MLFGGGDEVVELLRLILRKLSRTERGELLATNLFGGFSRSNLFGGNCLPAVLPARAGLPGLVFVHVRSRAFTCVLRL